MPPILPSRESGVRSGAACRVRGVQVSAHYCRRRPPAASRTRPPASAVAAVAAHPAADFDAIGAAAGWPASGQASPEAPGGAPAACRYRRGWLAGLDNGALNGAGRQRAGAERACDHQRGGGQHQLQSCHSLSSFALRPATLLPVHANPSLPIRFACLLQHWCHSVRVSSCTCSPRGLNRSRAGRRCRAGLLGNRLGDQILKAIAAVAARFCSGHGQRMRQLEAPARRLAVGHAAVDAAAARRAGMRRRSGGAALWHGGGPGWPLWATLPGILPPIAHVGKSPRCSHLQPPQDN